MPQHSLLKSNGIAEGPIMPVPRAMGIPADVLASIWAGWAETVL